MCSRRDTEKKKKKKIEKRERKKIQAQPKGSAMIKCPALLSDG